MTGCDPDRTKYRMRDPEEVQRSIEQQVMQIPGTEGWGIGTDAEGVSSILIYTKDATLDLPTHIEGIPTVRSLTRAV